MARMGKLHAMKFELLQLPCSPNILPSNYYLFKKMKNFGANNENVAEAEAYFESPEKLFSKKTTK